ncbi:MAG: RDD family protein, partial [Bryobacterales bacterium]|nr:RDD family protein [Bryobacterales bacterium]
MTCPRCGTANSVFETRCTRCGVAFGASAARGNARLLPERPSAHLGSISADVLPPGGARPFLVNPQARFSAVVANAVVVPPVTQAGADHPSGLVSAASTARRLDYHDASSPSATPHKTQAPAERPQLLASPPVAQPSLFLPGELPSRPPALRVHAPGTPSVPEQVFAGGPRPRRKPGRKRAKSDMLPFAQGTLEFLTPTAPPTRQLRTQVDATILCDQHGAAPMHRFAGALVDFALTLIASAAIAALCWLSLRQLGIALPENAQTIYWGLGAIWGLVVLSYQGLFTMMNAETPGYRALHLRV